jgi:predicted DNA-binding transcriptional regulator AlpA
MNLTAKPPIGGKTTPPPPPVHRVKSSSEKDAPVADRLLTPREVARKLGIGMQTLAKWHRAGKGPIYIELARNVTRYNAEDVKTFIEGLRSAGPASN